MKYSISLGHLVYSFESLAKLMAAASPKRSADELAKIAAKSEQERVAAQMILANLPLKEFLNIELIAANTDEVTRLIQDEFNAQAFSTIAHMTVGELREWLLSYSTQNSEIAKVRDGLTPEMVAAVSKIMRNQDLVLVSSKIQNITKFRNTIGLKGHVGVRLQPNHPTDDAKGILLGAIDGLLWVPETVIGINPASDSPKKCSHTFNFN
ncbi:MAG: ethanolamine ammonia-lyase subunit EutB [Bacteriovoracaceae bacterium]